MLQELNLALGVASGQDDSNTTPATHVLELALSLAPNSRQPYIAQTLSGKQTDPVIQRLCLAFSRVFRASDGDAKKELIQYVDQDLHVAPCLYIVETLLETQEPSIAACLANELVRRAENSSEAGDILRTCFLARRNSWTIAASIRKALSKMATMDTVS